MEISENQENLAKLLKNEILPWRNYTIGIDGVDGSGKSVLARYLAWDLGMPTIETDLLIVPNKKPPQYDYDSLSRLVEARHKLKRPVIIEGIFLLDTLGKINVTPDFLIYVNTNSFSGSHALMEFLKKYKKDYDPERKSQYIFNREFSDS